MDAKAETKNETAEDLSLIGSIFDIAKIVALAIVIAMFIRVFLFQPFNIPTGSMKATLLVGDYLFVSKFSYGYSRYSFPFAAKLFKGRLFGAQAQRGDVAVFHYKGTDYIKRVIGLPGDQVQVKHNRLFLNGKMLKREEDGKFYPSEYHGHKINMRHFREINMKRYRETLPGGHSYHILDMTETGPGDNTQLFVVPKGHYFMMGDNRDNSSDSRFNAPIGFVPAENLIGKAQFLYFSHEDMSDNPGFIEKIGLVRWGRLFTRIH